MNQSKIKQVIVVRKDLNMRKGKMCAQVAHAAMGAILENKSFDKNILKVSMTNETKQWLEESFTKVVVGVDSENKIYEIAKKAREVNLPCKVIVDNGFTEFRGNKTTTCVAIGPGKNEVIDEITGHLPLI